MVARTSRPSGKRDAVVRQQCQRRGYLDDIYVYLRARSNGAIPEGRPASREDKAKAIDAAESSCMGMK
jgi:hypothetical protein